ncbi:MAG: hypothetical protein K2H86_07710, partial [Muribaculaceae bacterium]|nr:hypothetical protein [Muribaculaceae bacterium]
MNKKCNWKNTLAGDGAGMLSPWVAAAYNILLLFVVYGLARVEFLLENYRYFEDSIAGVSDVWRLLCAGAVFDSPGIMYTNAIYILLMLLPLHYKENKVYYRVCKWLYIIVNSLALLMNVIDSVYFPYSMKRTTWDTLLEFGNESNLAGIFGVEVLHHWYLLVFTGLVIWGMWRLYAEPSTLTTHRGGRQYYAVSVIGLIIAICIVVSGIRGGWLNRWYLYLIALCLGYIAWRMVKSGRRIVAYILTGGAVGCLVIAPAGGWRHRDIRPIALSNANAYALRPIETALILNTPFAMIRTINSQSFVNPHYFENDAEALSIFTPVHNPSLSLSENSDKSDEGMRTHGMMRGRNIVIIILESFGEEYIGALNSKILGTRSVSYTPFLDSLINVSTRWRQGYDNGTKSIDAMPSVLASIPKMGKPFVLTSSAMRPIEGLPSLL